MIGILRTGAVSGKLLLGHVLDASPYALERACEVAEGLQKLWTGRVTAVILPAHKATLSRRGTALELTVRTGTAPTFWRTDPAIDVPEWAARFLSLAALDAWGKCPETGRQQTPGRVGHVLPMRYLGKASGPYAETRRFMRLCGEPVVSSDGYAEMLALLRP